MASHFQNRLVGISILVATVVIFLPSIIDGKKQTYEDEFVATPIHPPLKVHTQQLDTGPVSVAQSPKKVALPTPKPVANSDVKVTPPVVEDDQWQVEEIVSVAETNTPAKVVPARQPKVVAQAPTLSVPAAPKKKPLPDHAWTIQLGAFKNLANINSLLKTLHKAGFQAHTVPAQVIDGELTRLFVGPDVSKEKLKKQLPRLKRLTKLEGKLMPFSAVNP